MKTLYRNLKVGKTLNINADLTGNLSDPITSAIVTTSDTGIVTAGTADFASNPVTVALTGVAAGSATVTIEYASASESDCQSFIVNVEGC